MREWVVKGKACREILQAMEMKFFRHNVRIEEANLHVFSRTR